MPSSPEFNRQSRNFQHSLSMISLEAVTTHPPSRSIGSTAIFFHDPFCWTVGKIWLVDGQEHKLFLAVTSLHHWPGVNNREQEGIRPEGEGSKERLNFSTICPNFSLVSSYPSLGALTYRTRI